MHPDTEIFQKYPKVDLHRHLEGTLRLSTMLDVARAHSITVPESLSGLVQVQDQDPLTFQNFLAKFNTLRLFYRSPDVIHRITREAVEDAAKDNVRYLELRFTPVALSRAERFPLHDVMDWVITSSREAAKKYKMKVGLIASVNRHESPELAEQVAWLAAEHVGKGMVGMDLMLVDGRSARILRSFNSGGTFQTQSATSGMSLFGIGGGDAEFAASALGQATRVAMNDAVRKTADTLKSAPR